MSSLTLDASKPLMKDDEIPLFHDMLKVMAQHKASDLFISVGAPPKIKVQGRQYTLVAKSVTRDDVDVMITQGFDSDQILELDKRKEMNCAIALPRVGRFRVSAFIQRSTKAIVVRFIPTEVPKFDDLHLPVQLRDLILRKRGLILFVGPTGCGKSTTLAALINLRNELNSDHIITIEDPIEYLFRHRRSIVNQRELGTDALSYGEALRNAMRQAPDVILIGEIRDKESMVMAMQYAQSGHLCLATMHANNSYNALNRIVSFFPPETRGALFPDLSSSLRAIVSQRLVPTLPSGILRPAVEVMVNTRSVAEAIEQGNISVIPELMEQQASDGVITFEKSLLDMVLAELISVEQAILFCDSPTNLYSKLSQVGYATKSQEEAVRRKAAGAPENGHAASAAEAAMARSDDRDSLFSGIRIQSDHL